MSSTTVTRPLRPAGPRIVRGLITVAIVVPVLWSAIGLGISPERIARAPGLVWDLLAAMFPPDWSNTGRTIDKIFESLYIAWIGTIIGAALSFPLGFMAATNVAPQWVSGPVRGALSAIRAFPELVLAIVFIPAFGLGPFTATLAIGIHSIGTLGKLTSEVIEGVEAGPVEAIGSAGGTRLQQWRFGVIPQAMPNIVAYWLYRFEINIRASAVLGVIGAGGVGDELVGRLRFRADWPKAGAVLILTILTVLAIDAISASIRRRIITGGPSEGVLSKWMSAIVGDRPSPAAIETAK